MPLFSHKNRSASPAETMLASTGRPGPDQVPAKLRVAAVTEPGVPVGSEAALVSGLLLGPFPVYLVQCAVFAPRATWPSPDTELPAVADPANPLNYTVVWAQVPGDGRAGPAVRPQSGPAAGIPGRAGRIRWRWPSGWRRPGSPPGISAAGWRRSRPA